MAKISTVAIIEAVRLKEMTTTPDTTGAGYSAIYAQSDGLYFVDDEKNETGPLSAGGFENPMTTIGAIIYGTTAGAALELSPGSDDEVLTLASGVPTWAAAAAGGSGLYSDYICIRDQKAQNTAGGTFTTGAWQTRVLNTEVVDTGSDASLSSNQITLAAGTYRCLISAPAYKVARNQTRLYNTTGAVVVLLGTSEYISNSNTTQTRSFIMGRFTIAASQALEVQHRCETTVSSNGFGVESNFTTEVYTIAEFWKEA